jgi:hypothetical protein
MRRTAQNRRELPEGATVSRARRVFRPTSFLRREVDRRHQLGIAHKGRLQHVRAPSDHVPGGDGADKLRSFTGVHDHVTRILVDWLIIRPLDKFLSRCILEQKVIFAAIVELQRHRFLGSIDQYNPGLKRPGIREFDRIG